MSKYFCDCEFNGFGGEIISFALVREDGAYLSLIFGCDEPEPWVAEHVMPVLWSGEKSHPENMINESDAAKMILGFIGTDLDPVIITDWPDDIRYFCELIMTGPGTMVAIRNLTFRMIRCDTYPTDLEGAIQHNAFWDAMALRHELLKK
jgi:hypothetical protein